MHMDPLLPTIAGIALTVLILGALLQRFKQPPILGYIIAGILLGPSVLGVVNDIESMTRFGSIGVLLLLFFVGMEVSLPRLLTNWRIIVLGTLLQIVLSVGFVLLVGNFLNWPLGRGILLGFVISLSSTAVVIKILQGLKQLESEVGRDVLGILLVQDMAIIPMLIIINFYSGTSPENMDIVLQICGAILFLLLIVWIVRHKELKFPFSQVMKRDSELQVFSALFICLSLALVSDFFHLSTALGAFIAGILVASAKETVWVHRNLEPFHILFLSFFFVSIGFLLDIDFLLNNLATILMLVGAAFILNTSINAGILRIFKIPWRRSLYTGAILAQIGEFSFVLASVGWQTKMITQTGYQLSIAVITLTLLLSPFWILLFGRLTKQST
ncbi:MAG: cation:proton antiporter [Candidatus Marinimicrobia bacterium]|nr:cation:proton antiporter [Candidatus Neomarinimicrobiota bacterium]